MAAKKNPTIRVKSPGKSIPNQQRKRKRYMFTLSDDEKRMLDEIAEGRSASAVIGELIFAAHTHFRKPSA